MQRTRKTEKRAKCTRWSSMGRNVVKSGVLKRSQVHGYQLEGKVETCIAQGCLASSEDAEAPQISTGCLLQCSPSLQCLLSSISNLLTNLRKIYTYFKNSHTDWHNFLMAFRDKAKHLGTTFSKHVPRGWEVGAVNVGGQPWKLTKEGLNGVSRLSQSNRVVRGLAGHWVGKEIKKGYGRVTAKEHFRKSQRRRGQDEDG
jgi:hypothetical protein